MPWIRGTAVEQRFEQGPVASPLLLVLLVQTHQGWEWQVSGRGVLLFLALQNQRGQCVFRREEVCIAIHLQRALPGQGPFPREEKHQCFRNGCPSSTRGNPIRSVPSFHWVFLCWKRSRNQCPLIYGDLQQESPETMKVEQHQG